MPFLLGNFGLESRIQGGGCPHFGVTGMAGVRWRSTWKVWGNAHAHAPVAPPRCWRPSGGRGPRWHAQEGVQKGSAPARRHRERQRPDGPISGPAEGRLDHDSAPGRIHKKLPFFILAKKAAVGHSPGPGVAGSACPRSLPAPRVHPNWRPLWAPLAQKRRQEYKDRKREPAFSAPARTLPQPGLRSVRPRCPASSPTLPFLPTEDGAANAPRSRPGRSLMRRASIRIKVMACSAVGSVGASGGVDHADPLAVAASTSTLSYPMPDRRNHPEPGRASIQAPSEGGRLEMTTRRPLPRPPRLGGHQACHMVLKLRHSPAEAHGLGV